MKNTIFIEKSYIVASILNAKSEFFRKEFVTIEELIYISSKLQKEINDKKINAIILDIIDTDYFDVSDIIKINSSKGLSLDSIINHYQGYLDLEVLLLIWNKENILNYLSEFKIIERINEDKKNFDILAVPCNRAFVVSKNKKEAFLNVKPNPEIRQQQEKIVKLFKTNNLTNNENILKKVRKTDKK